jgi:Fur family ferric uptake transcriptional regulator
MQHHDDINLLRGKGYRLTRQRMLILDIVRGSDQHITADEIFAAVSCRHSEINLATVYRTLQWLHEVGLLHKFDVGKDRLEYEYARAVHHHLICKTCGMEQEIDNHVVECLRAHILEHYDFEADPEHLAIFGRCTACRTTTE